MISRARTTVEYLKAHCICPFAHLYLWRALSALAETKLVKDYKYMIQDLRMKSRQTISGKFFKDKSRGLLSQRSLGNLGAEGHIYIIIEVSNRRMI